MIIRKLELHNFGVYSGTNSFEFESAKPVVLIGGLNGRGKTTFLEAVLLALYGANSFAYKESKFHTYGQYLRSLINISDKSLRSYIMLKFILNGNEYVVKRSWDSLKKKGSNERLYVKKNKEYNDFLTANWSMFIENILPSAVSNFFFFDGEKIAELAVDETDYQLKESIRSMLGLSILDTLKSDLRRYVNKTKKKINNSVESQTVDMLREAKENAQNNLDEIQNQINDEEENLTILQDLLERNKAAFIANGGEVIEKYNDLIKEKTTLQTLKVQNRESMLQLASGELPLLMVRDLIKKIIEQSRAEIDSGIKKKAIEYLNNLYAVYNKDNSLENSTLQFMNYVNKQLDVELVDNVYSLSDAGINSAEYLERTKFKTISQEVISLLKQRKEIDDKINEIDNYLSIDVNEENVRRLYKEIKTVERNIDDCNAAIDYLKKKRSIANGELIKITSQFNKSVVQYLDIMELNDEVERCLKYAEMASRVINEYSIRLQKDKIGKLGDTITQCYRKLSNKKNLIEYIEMNPLTLDFTYKNHDGSEVAKTSLSAGEKQLMVIAILWALGICSNKKLPVIIDTPLSRLDSNHREALIKTYFPNASEQTIILSTDSEIDRHYYYMLEKNVGDEFTLQYNDETGSTTIQNGYFWGMNNAY